MAKWKADIDFKDKENNKLIKAGEEFEETIKRVEEIKDNIKKDYKIDIKFTRLDKDE